MEKREIERSKRDREMRESSRETEEERPARVGWVERGDSERHI